eukprot:6281278-Pyramimonas_sp.AAC.1
MQSFQGAAGRAQDTLMVPANFIDSGSYGCCVRIQAMPLLAQEDPAPAVNDVGHVSVKCRCFSVNCQGSEPAPPDALSANCALWAHDQVFRFTPFDRPSATAPLYPTVAHCPPLSWTGFGLSTRVVRRSGQWLTAIGCRVSMWTGGSSSFKTSSGEIPTF